jgi:outer membrane lipoprotein carrier protein
MKLRHLAAGGLLAAATALAQAADAVAALRAFAADAKSARAEFTQTVTSPDGKRTKSSNGSFEFQRPNRFRFVYAKPFAQTIVGDGQKVWIHDPDLNQVSTRKMNDALGATPAALLAGASLERDFTLGALPDADGLSWVQATPKAQEGSFQTLKVGFRGNELAAIDIIDNFGQRSLIRFDKVATNVPIAAEAFRFTVPPGADVIEQ